MKSVTLNDEVRLISEREQLSPFDLAKSTPLSYQTWYNYKKPDAYMMQIDVRLLQFLLSHIGEERLKDLIISHVKTYKPKTK